MKRCLFTLSNIVPPILGAIIKMAVTKSKKLQVITVLIIAIVSFSGCFKNYFKVNSRSITDSASLATLKNVDKFFILHLKNSFFAMKNISANGDMIEGDLQILPPERYQFVNAGDGGFNTYRSKDKTLLFSEIHLYAPRVIAKDSSHISIPLKSISKIDIFEKDSGKTIGSYVLGGLGIFMGLTLFTLIALLIACNCPQVYTFDGSQYNFKSGVFSGAIYSSLEKTDYLPLDNIQSIQGKYLFKLANNQKEEQFINQVQLINVQHDRANNVLLDRQGTAHTYRNLSEAHVENVSKEVSEAIKYKDDNVFMFNHQSDKKSKFGSLILNFNKETAVNEGKLIIHAKNTFWSGYIFEEFSSMFGNKYKNWVARQDKADKKVLEKWQKEQALPLMVYVETNKGWTFVDYFPFTGNTAGRDMIMKLDLPANKKSVRIKIECTYMFWELDYAAMDFSADEPVQINYINPKIASINKGETNVAQLSTIDKKYTALREDESIKVEFAKATGSVGKANSLFLSTTGYYHNNKEYSGKPQTAILYQFKKKGAFNEYSKMKNKFAQEALAKGVNLKYLKNED